jgi:hypothetical protein
MPTALIHTLANFNAFPPVVAAPTNGLPLPLKGLRSAFA